MISALMPCKNGDYLEAESSDGSTGIESSEGSTGIESSAGSTELVISALIMPEALKALLAVAEILSWQIRCFVPTSFSGPFKVVERLH